MWAGDTVEGSQQAGGRQTDSGPHSYCGVASPSSPGASWLPALPSLSTNRARNTVLVDQEAC